MAEKELLQKIVLLNKRLNLYKLSRQDCFQKITVVDCHSSNAIEGNMLTKFEIENLLSKGYPDKVHSNEEQEIIDYEYTRNIILDWYRRGERDLTIEKIVQLHSSLIQNPLISGYIRQKAGIDEVQISGRDDISLTAASQVYTELEDILEIYNSNLGENVPVNKRSDSTQARLLEVIVDFKYDYVCVHPFLDGNGRTSRLLLNFMLMVNGFRPICIDSEDSGRTYKDAIYLSQRTGDISYFRVYMYKEIIRNYENYINENRIDGIGGELCQFPKK